MSSLRPEAAHGLWVQEGGFSSWTFVAREFGSARPFGSRAGKKYDISRIYFQNRRRVLTGTRLVFSGDREIRVHLVWYVVTPRSLLAPYTGLRKDITTRRSEFPNQEGKSRYPVFAGDC